MGDRGVGGKSAAEKLVPIGAEEPESALSAVERHERAIVL